MSKSEDNERIARNTAMLYVRMFLTIAVSLYTSRVVLQNLGVEDFGVYNIVGGVIIFFQFLNNAMSSATQRFLNYALGNRESEEVQKIFSMSLTAHISIILIVIFLAETIGLWFINTQLNIPFYRMKAANWVYQFSLLTFCVQIIQVPYNASIIAYEKMQFYAYISIIEVILKLLIVFLLVYFGFDKLIFYSILLFMVAIIVLTLYKLFCNKVFSTCRYNFFWNYDLYKKLMSFSGWSLFGSAAVIGVQQGLNILLNIFYGVTVNAAMGVANQLSHTVYNFVSNFQIAFKPQIVKSYAAGDSSYLISLIFRTSKFSFFLLLLIALPILISCEFILKLWLVEVPEYSVSFCRLTILFLLIEAISAPLWMSIQATGKIRNYQILISSIILVNIPLAYVALMIGINLEYILIIRVLVNLFAFMIRIIYSKNSIRLPIRSYFKEVICVTLAVSVLALPLPLITNHYFVDWIGFISTLGVSFFTTGFIIYWIGLTKHERNYFKYIFMQKITKIKYISKI